MQAIIPAPIMHEILSVGGQIRHWLMDEFPDHAPALTNQCKRAAILFDLYAKKRTWESRIRSGWIKGKGHVWNEVYLGNQWCVVDTTLTQFQMELEQPIPEVIMGKRRDILPSYRYLWDGKGNYPYRIEDVRPSLRQRLTDWIQVMEGKEWREDQK